MALLHSDVLCPYCLEELRASDVKMTCPLCGTLAEQSRVEMIMGKLPKCKQPGCHKSPASDRTCKYCSSKLPSDILDYEKYLRFSILGVSGSGKTTFLTTMLHELRHSPNSPWVIAPMDADTSSDTAKKYRHPWGQFPLGHCPHGCRYFFAVSDERPRYL